MNIAFHSQQLGLGGTEIALYDYAYYCRHYLEAENIIIFYPKSAALNNPAIINKFELRFPTIGYNSVSEIQHQLSLKKIEYFYNIKYGFNDGMKFKDVRNINHAVFDISQPHGDRFAAISKWMVKDTKIPYVPHMINIPKMKTNYRSYFNIPDDAIVFGRHGSYDSFDIQFVKDCVSAVSNEKNNIYFLFLNTKEFECNSDKCIFIEATENRNYLGIFINTCDAMLHGRARGETYGLAVGEFSIYNKPVLTYMDSFEKSHIDILGDKGLYYKNIEDLYFLLTNFQEWYDPNTNYDCYSKEYSYIPVMKKFKEVFL